MKRGTDEYRAFHRAEMAAWRAKKQGPKRQRPCQGWRGVKEIAVCFTCKQEFERTRQPQPAKYCGDKCRNRRGPLKGRKKAEVTRCTGCEWRCDLACWHPALANDLRGLGSVGLRVAGKCPRNADPSP